MDEKKKLKKLRYLLFGVIGALIIVTIVQSVVLCVSRSRLDRLSDDYQQIQEQLEEPETNA